MYVATVRITIHLFASDSLKDKRQVLRSVLARARNQFEVSAAEVGSQELWNQAEIGLAYVSNSAAHAEEVIEHAIRSIEASRPDIEITQATTDVLTVE
jgi:uncharacterized protein